MEEADVKVQARTYLRRLLAFNGVWHLMVGLVILGEVLCLWVKPALIGPNFFTYGLIVLLVGNELVVARIKKFALREGSHPNQHPPPDEALPYIASYVRVEKWLKRSWWVCLVGGHVLRSLVQTPWAPGAGMALGLLCIPILMLCFAWDYWKVGLWESLLVLASYLSLVYFILYMPTISVTDFSLTFGGLQFAAGFFLMRRWRVRAREARREQSQEEEVFGSES